MVELRLMTVGFVDHQTPAIAMACITLYNELSLSNGVLVSSDIFVNDNRIKTKIQNEFVNENWNGNYNF